MRRARGGRREVGIGGSEGPAGQDFTAMKAEARNPLDARRSSTRQSPGAEQKRQKPGLRR